MKLSENFDLREFIPKSTYLKYGTSATWFVKKEIVEIAEFYKSFFFDYFKKKYGVDKVKNVLIVVNNWNSGGGKQYSGYRPPEYTEGAKESQHRAFNAFDCEIIIVFTDGKRIEAEYSEIHKVILSNEDLFLSKGVKCIESLKDAPTWLHTDIRYIPNQTKILIVNK